VTDPVTIIGAGPAGLAAAIVLRRSGIPVVVHEKGEDVGTRLSGDFQGLENWSSREDVCDSFRRIGIETDFLCVPYRSGTIFAPKAAPVAVGGERPIFYLVRRGNRPGSLDRGLRDQALALGAEIIFNRKSVPDEGAIVGTGPRMVGVLAKGYLFRTPLPDTAAVAFDDRLAPKGYSYLLVNGGEATLATVLYRDFERSGECLERTRRFFGERFDLGTSVGEPFCGYGNTFLWPTRRRGRPILVGESAGFQDGLWGFGMRYAVISGWLAAKSIIEGTDYEGLCERYITPLVRTSVVNRFLFEICGHPGYRYLTRRLSNGRHLRYLHRHYNPSLLKRFLLPLASRYVPGPSHSDFRIERSFSPP
jgi:flavin-dependent dehydrogenase